MICSCVDIRQFYRSRHHSPGPRPRDTHCGNFVSHHNRLFRKSCRRVPRHSSNPSQSKNTNERNRRKLAHAIVTSPGVGLTGEHTHVNLVRGSCVRVVDERVGILQKTVLQTLPIYTITLAFETWECLCNISKFAQPCTHVGTGPPPCGNPLWRLAFPRLTTASC
jgi:hypothetical protein